MRIEDDIFARYTANKEKLIEYGFCRENDSFVWKSELPDFDFRIIIEYTDRFSGRLIDLATDEEYINYRLENPEGFSKEVREAFERVLTDIRDHCCENNRFFTLQGQRLSAYMTEAFNDDPEFLWKKLPGYAVFRKKKSGKWYALIGDITRGKVDKSAPSDEKTEILNVKSNRVEELLKKEGIYPAYHMNKKYWITVILDDSLSDETAQALIRESFDLV